MTGFRTTGMARGKMTGPGPDPSCKKCSGTGWFVFSGDTSQVCNVCCKHDQGWWLLTERYGDENGKWCCKAGCGKTVETPPS